VILDAEQVEILKSVLCFVFVY